ncbi:hypothetical protein COOONC_09861 [Cooperia oncophora]
MTGSDLSDEIKFSNAAFMIKPALLQVLKNVIKLVVKIGLLARNDMLSETDIKQLENVQKQLHSLALTIISFVQVKYSFERTHLIELLKSLKQSLMPLVSLKLSDNSTRRLEHVINHLTNTHFLDALFKVDGPHAEVLAEFVASMEDLLESEDL